MRFISSTDISSTTVYQGTGQLCIQLLLQQIIIFINSNLYLHYDSLYQSHFVDQMGITTTRLRTFRLHTTPYEIIELAKSSTYSRSEGPDGIDPLVGRRTIEQTADIISEIIKSSFETGLIPPDLKKLK